MYTAYPIRKIILHNIGLGTLEVFMDSVQSCLVARDLKSGMHIGKNTQGIQKRGNRDLSRFADRVKFGSLFSRKLDIGLPRTNGLPVRCFD